MVGMLNEVLIAEPEFGVAVVGDPRDLRTKAENYRAHFVVRAREMAVRTIG
jgi:hypothetical protein